MNKSIRTCKTGAQLTMKTIIYCLAAISLPAAVAFSQPSVPGNAGAEGEAGKRIQSNLLPFHYLQDHVTRRSIPQVMIEENIPGVSIAFVDKGEIAWRLVYGYARLADAQRVTPETVFAGASLSKPVAAMAALKLVDQGLLSLDEDVNSQLTGWKVPENEFTEKRKITLRRLVGHTAGIQNHLWSSYGVGENIPTLEQMLAGEEPSVDPAVTVTSVPGDHYKYSNPGYSIVQKLIRDATGQSFQRAIERLVFTPAGMSDSSFDQPIPARLMERSASGYSKELQPYPYRIFPFEAAGGLWTTPSDLARFMAAVIDDYHMRREVLISRQMAEEIFSRSEARLGFAKKLGTDSDLVFEHWGSNAGFTSYVVGSLEDRQGLVIMTNSDNGFGLMASIARSVAREYGWTVLEPTVYRPVSMSVENMKRFAGKFGSGAGADDEVTFSVQGHALNVADGGTTHALVPVAENKFILPSQYKTYEFLEGKDGAISWVRVTSDSGYNYDLSRVEPG